MPRISRRINIAAILVGTLLCKGCQLHTNVTKEGTTTATAKVMVDASTQPVSSLQSSTTSKHHTSATPDHNPGPSTADTVPAPAPRPTCTTIVYQPQTVVNSATQDAYTLEASPAATLLAKVGQQESPLVLEETHVATPGEEQTDFQRWFQEFVKAVDDEEVLELGHISYAIPQLVQEGRTKGYLNQAMKTEIYESTWNVHCTPLHYAAAKSNKQAVAALLKERDVKIDAPTLELGSTPLHFAAYAGSIEAAQLLIEGYRERNMLTQIDVRDQEGNSPLQCAALGPWDGMNRDVADLLVRNGADPMRKSDNCTLVDMAAFRGNIAMIDYWLEEISGTDRMEVEEDKKIIRSAYKLAKRRQQNEIANSLLHQYERLSQE